MTTKLDKFDEAYATMTVAVYEPLVMRWISSWCILCAANDLALRIQKGKHIQLDKAFATAGALGVPVPRPRPPKDFAPADPVERPGPNAGDFVSRPLAPNEVRKVDLEGFPDAVQIGDTVYPYGAVNLHQSGGGTPEVGGFAARALRIFSGRRTSGGRGDPFTQARTIPTFIGGSTAPLDPDFDLRMSRARIFKTMMDAARASLAGNGLLADHLRGALRDSSVGIFEFLPPFHIEEALSPIGIAHYYRQLYFNTVEGFGPIEEAFTIAPLETLEVMYETVRRQVHEEIIEKGFESVSEAATEEKNLDEVSDKVSSMIQRDMSASMSANASGTIGVWQAGASVSANMGVSTQRGREEARRRLKEVTKRASERITKSFTIKTRSVEELTTTNVTRRVIRNEEDHPVSFGLRRVLRRVLVKVQDLGPRLVWQIYVQSPGTGLARSRFVHFREADPIAPPEIPPGVRPRPKGGTDTGTTSSNVITGLLGYGVALVIQTTPDRVITAVSIDSIADLEGGGKGDLAPSPRNNVQWNKNWDETTHTFSVNIGILPGDAASVSINYTYTWEPSQEVMDGWEAERQAAVDKITEELLAAQFEREKALITEKSKIRPRPANDLRREERFEVLNRMVSQLFGRGDDPSDPTPLEIEYFHRYFDLEGMFVYQHPAWWKPRYTSAATGLAREAYEVTAESDPAPLGSSLGWLIQIDGDDRRNEFINSPWIRVCMPMRPGREREAVAWLAKHVEGEIGYDPSKNPLKRLLEDIEQRRDEENQHGADGPNYVTVKSAPGAPNNPATPEGVFPIVSEFEVTVPTDGFVYDELKLS